MAPAVPVALPPVCVMLPPKTLTVMVPPVATETGAWKAAPPVLEFDQAGTLVSWWGGPGPGYEWPQLEHGIHVGRKRVARLMKRPISRV